MSLFFRRTLYINLISCLLSITAHAQISNKNADKKVVASYSRYDTIYVFYKNIANLKAINPNTKLASFSWSKYDTISLSFPSPFQTDDSVATSSISKIGQGGYKVHISNSSGLDTSFTAWVFLDSLTISLEKDDKSDVPYYRCTCDYTDFFATVYSSKFKYYNPLTKESFLLGNPLTYTWWSSANPTFTNNSSHLRDYDPPYQDTYYYVKVTDALGLFDSDTVLYKSIIAKALFSQTGDSIVNGKNSAPFKVTFTNTSINENYCKWYFGDGDTLISKESPIFHTYYEPKTYHVSLVAQSKELCTDTFTVDITVEKPQITCPNVFTPGGKNPYFKIENISIRRFKITIYSRWGKKVYEAEGDNMLDWEGWDGNISGSHASDGAYYYTLEVFTWDKAPDPKLINTNGRYSGFFYLFRAK